MVLLFGAAAAALVARRQIGRRKAHDRAEPDAE
jgi:hypothetical protein